MEPTHTSSRAPIAALSDVETFLLCAQSLKATTQALRARQRRESGIQRALAMQIAAMTQQCESMSAKSKRLREMWRQVQAELADDKPPQVDHEDDGAATAN